MGKINDYSLIDSIKGYEDSKLVIETPEGTRTVTPEQIVNPVKETLRDLEEQIEQGGIGGGAVTPAMYSTLLALLNKCMFVENDVTNELNAFKNAWGNSGSGEPVNPNPPSGGDDEPTTPTLTGITVTWVGDSADVGTDPRTLITSVKANYSDGSSQNVTGYSVTPVSLVEGSQMVTVSYNGKISTKTITGNEVIAERSDIKGEKVYDYILVKNKDYNFYQLSSTSAKTYIINFEGNKEYEVVYDLDNQYRNVAIGTSNFSTIKSDINAVQWLGCTTSDMRDATTSRITATMINPIELTPTMEKTKGDDDIYRTAYKIKFAENCAYSVDCPGDSIGINVYEV